MDKLVSVIIPTFERSDTLSRTIDSVLCQTYKNIEIIVVDDNNSDTKYRKKTKLIMEEYKGFKNIFYIKHEKNKNGSAARNTGFRNSKGEYIMFLDDDDEFYKDKVCCQVNKMNSLDQSWGACYTNYVRKKNDKIVVYGAEKREGNLLVEELMRNLFVHAGSNLMVRREIVSELHGFDESFYRNQDIEFLTRILIKYKLAYADTVGLIVHTDGGKIKRKKNFEEITSDYINKFSNLIKKLSDSDRLKVERMISLQLFRYYLSSRKFKDVIKIIGTNDIPINCIIRYLLYLSKRFVTRKAYGFDL